MKLSEENARQAYVLSRSKASNRANGCWRWTNACQIGLGYGMAWWKGQHFRAHRFAYAAFKGVVKDGLQVLHTCDNASCVNPDHLKLGTHKDNMADKVKRNRLRRGEQHQNAKLTDRQVKGIRDYYERNKGLRFWGGSMLAKHYGVARNTICYVVHGNKQGTRRTA